MNPESDATRRRRRASIFLSAIVVFHFHELRFSYETFFLEQAPGRCAEPEPGFVFQGTEELEVRILVQARPGQDIRSNSSCVSSQRSFLIILTFNSCSK